MKESVLVIPKAFADDVAPCSWNRMAMIFSGHQLLEKAIFMDREAAETNKDFKQIIPYIVIENNGKFLLSWRTKKQTETRLHQKYSLGIGGHINPIDMDKGIGRTIITGAHREIDEEINFPDGDNRHEMQFIGVINDYTGDVEAVHLGLVFILKPVSQRFVIQEKDKFTAEWKTPEELSGYVENMEAWSKFIYSQIISRS